jgi:hypothetical protein
MVDELLKEDKIFESDVNKIFGMLRLLDDGEEEVLNFKFLGQKLSELVIGEVSNGDLKLFYSDVLCNPTVSFHSNMYRER